MSLMDRIQQVRDEEYKQHIEKMAGVAYKMNENYNTVRDQFYGQFSQELIDDIKEAGIKISSVPSEYTSDHCNNVYFRYETGIKVYVEESDNDDHMEPEVLSCGIHICDYNSWRPEHGHTCGNWPETTLVKYLAENLFPDHK